MLDPDLIHFVRTHVRSIWALEVLLLLRRKAPEALTQEEIVSTLRASPGLIRRVIDELAGANLVVGGSSGAFRFECGPDHARLCEALEAAAQDRPIALRDAIASSPNNKLRNFSDAFRLKGKDKDREGDT